MNLLLNNIANLFGMVSVISAILFGIILFKSKTILNAKQSKAKVLLVLGLLFIICMAIAGTIQPQDKAQTTVASAKGEKIAKEPTDLPTATPTPTNAPTPTATPTPVPTDVNGFPMDYQTVTVSQIAKVPSAYNGKTVMFSCNVLSFAKNSSGDAAAINCEDPNSYGSLIQVSGGLFDFTQINQGDTVRIYGTGSGAATGKNAFGGEITEGLVDGLFINDLTTGYKNN